MKNNHLPFKCLPVTSVTQLYQQHLENKEIALLLQMELVLFHVTSSKYKIKKHFF